MTDLRKAAQMALEELEYIRYGDQFRKTIDALRAALAQPEPEPFGWLYESKAGDRIFHLISDDKKFQADWEAAQQYPEAHKMTPLYLHPPQRKPLTEKEIDELMYSMAGADRANDRFRTSFARAIEKAHGIGVEE